MSDTGKALKFGDRDPVMNIAASDDNPIKFGMFVRRIGCDIEYMTDDGRTHRTPADNIAKAGTNPADEIASLRAQVESAVETLKLWRARNTRMSDTIEELQRQLAKSREALEFIRDGYDRIDINHVDFRVGAYKAALTALSDEAQP